jgi:hypothetical protein
MKMTACRKNLLQTCKPDSVPRPGGAVIIYLAGALLQQSCCLPFSIGRVALKRWYTWHYSTQGLPLVIITYYDRELLPHVFTLIRQGRTVIFCGTIFPARWQPKPGPDVIRCATLCCPDFPPCASINSAQSDNPACSNAKILQISGVSNQVPANGITARYQVILNGLDT